MRKVKTVVASITALFILGAIAAAAAYGALPEFLPGSGKFTDVSKESSIEIAGGDLIKCASDTATGEIINPKDITATIDFQTCKFTTLVNVNSLGDPTGVILTTVGGELCYLNKGEKKVGIVLKPTGKIHLEFAGFGILDIVEGSLIGEVKPVNRKLKEGYEIVLQQAAGAQKILKCEGGAETHLVGAEDEGANKAAGLATIDDIKFENETEVMA
jgi:hypothetical protein